MGDLNLWLTVIIAALLSLLAVYFAVAPLLRPGRAAQLVEDDKLVELLGRKDATLRAIKDLEFDYHVGKMSEEDYQRHDQRLRRQAIGLIQQIEKVAPASASLDEQLESIIARFRQTSTAQARALPIESAPAPDATVPVTASPATDTVQASRFCTQCGHPVQPNHKFCANCGTPVAQVDAAAQV
jgi:NADH pyrophosphatase NudC (nudix superfamily)